MSWCTSWKCHRYLPVFASTATTDEENRLLPGRSMPTRSLFGAPSGTYRMPRSASRDVYPQTLTPERFLALSAPHVSYPNSPGRGTLWNVHASLPVRASHARVSPAGPVPPADPPGPSPTPAPVMIRF